MEGEISSAPVADSAPAESTENKAPESAPEKAGKSGGDSAPVEKKKYKVKVDKEELEVDEDELIRSYSHKKASDKRFMEAAEMRKQVDAQLAQLKDPKAIFGYMKQNFSKEITELAKDYIYEQIQEEAMSPEQRAARDKDRELEDYRAKDKEAKEKAAKEAEENEKRTKAEQHQARMTEHMDKFTNDVQTFFNDAKVKPSVPQVRELLGLMIAAGEKGADLSIKDAWAAVNKEWERRVNAHLQSLDVKHLPKELVDKIAAHLSEKVTTFKARPAQAASKPVESDKEKMDDYFANLRR
jgi:hypothetical protein